MPDTATAPAPLRFSTGARARDVSNFYDESRIVLASSLVMPEMVIPPGDWLKDIAILVDVAGAANAAAVAAQADAPWTLFAEIAFLDAGGNTVHSLSGYNMMLANLLGGYRFQTDPTGSPYFTALTVGAGATAPTGSFILRVPVEIIDREAVGAYPNAASNAVTRIRLTLAPALSTWSVPGTAGTTTVRVRGISTGYVMPSSDSPAGRAYSPEPPGAGTFQQWSQLSYDLTVGRRTIQHTRKGQTYRTLIFVARTAAGVRSDTLLNELEFRVDDVPVLSGLWRFCRDTTWHRQLVTAANLPAGVVQVSFAHEWDGKVGGELRENWVITAPGSKVEIELDVAVAGTLEVITNEIIPVAGSGVLRV